ncbi:MAG: hypothetical protein ACP5O1_04790 [Phycisphaerae bacterium]
MASNKKKDAAALYELLDKSTLKVTRKPGAPLKIPSWWSGRNNPAQGKGAADEKSADTSAAPSAPPPDPNALGSAASQRDIASGGMMISRAQELFLRYRPLILVAAAILVMIMIMLIIFHHSGKGKRTAPPATVVMPGGVTPRLVPDNSEDSNSASTPIPASQQVVQAPAPKTHRARVYPSSQVNRRDGYYYLVIVTTLPQYARSAARFIAAHGVSVTIEPAQSPYDAVVSVRGFKHRASRAARAFQRRVVQIGYLMPGANRLHRSVFNTAFYAQVHRSN